MNFDLQRILDRVEEKSTYKIAVYRFDKTLVITKNKQGTRNLDLYLRYYISNELLADYSDKEQIYEVIQTIGESLIREYHFAPPSGINGSSITLDDLQGLQQRKQVLSSLKISPSSLDIIVSAIENYMMETQLEMKKFLEGTSDYTTIFVYRDPIKRVVSGVAQDVISMQMDGFENKIILRAALDVENNQSNKILYDTLYKVHEKEEDGSANSGVFKGLEKKLPENSGFEASFLYNIKANFFKKITKEYMSELKFENQHSGPYLYALWPIIGKLNNIKLLNLDAKGGGTIDIHKIIDSVEEKDRAIYIMTDAMTDTTKKELQNKYGKLRDNIYQKYHQMQKNDALKDLVYEVIDSLVPTSDLAVSFVNLISKEMIHYNTMKLDSSNFIPYEEPIEDED